MELLIEISYHLGKEAEQFEALCLQNRLQHRKAIEEDRQRLLNAGVPEKYLFVLQVNYPIDGKGDLYAFQNTEFVESQLHWIQNEAKICCSPDVFLFSVVDLRDRKTIRARLSEDYFEDGILDEMLADVEERTLVFRKENQPELFEDQRDRNEHRRRNLITSAYHKLGKQGVEKTFISLLVTFPDKNDLPILFDYSNLESVMVQIRTQCESRQEVSYPDAFKVICVDRRLYEKVSVS